MRRLLLVLVAAFVLVSIGHSANGQSVRKILDRYKQAAGGSAVQRVKSTVMIGTVAANGESGSGRFSYQASTPDRIRVEVEAGSAGFAECFNGKSAWLRDHRGVRTLLGPDARSLRLYALMANTRLRNPSRDRVVVTPSQKISIRGRDAYGLKLDLNGAEVTLFFDTLTGLLTRHERTTSNGFEQINYGDYRKIDGVMEPFELQIKRQDAELRVVIQSVTHNTAVNDVEFRYPKTEDRRPMPDVESLMKAVEANQERLERLREEYTFRETEVERKLDGGGRVKEATTKVYDVTPVGDNFVRRLVSVNGALLSPSEQQKEDRRVQEEVEETIKRIEKEKEKKKKTRTDESKSDDDDLSLLTFLRMAEVTSVRREDFKGREVIAFDFEPRKGFKPANRVETLVSKLAGTIWVDEDAREIARLEARLVSTFKLGGGLLASVSPATAIVFEQEKVDQDLWLPSFAEANIAARVFLFAKFNRSTTTQYSDYKKQKIDSDYRLAAPANLKKP